MIGDCRCLAGAFGRGLLRQLHKRLHLGREPLIFVVEQLASHGHGAVGDVQAGDTPGGEGVPDDVFRQEESPSPRSTIWHSSAALPSSK